MKVILNINKIKFLTYFNKYSKYNIKYIMIKILIN